MFFASGDAAETLYDSHAEFSGKLQIFYSSI